MGYSHSSLIVLTISSTLEFGEYRTHHVYNDDHAYIGDAYTEISLLDFVTVKSISLYNILLHTASFFRSKFRGMNDVYTYRMDHIMWSVRPRDGRITIGNNKKPLLRNKPQSYDTPMGSVSNSEVINP